MVLHRFVFGSCMRRATLQLFLENVLGFTCRRLEVQLGLELCSGANARKTESRPKNASCFLSRQVQACNHVKLDIQECQSSQFLMASVNIYLLLAGSLASLCVSAFWGFCRDRASVASLQDRMCNVQQELFQIFGSFGHL